MPKHKLQSIRDGFGQGLLDLAGQNKDVVALTADLGSSLKMDDFKKMYPNRFIEVGIAEQNMAGIAAGLALEGKIPYAGTFASFQPMRNLDQIRTSICIMDAPVKLVSSHAGFSYAADGVQIQALEDIAIMRSLPNMEVFVPADAEQAAQLTKLIANTNKPAYLRLGRADAPVLSTCDLVDKDLMGPLELGRAQLLQSGGDATIIATGYMVYQALIAAKLLREQGVYASVINIHTIKPLDRETVLQAAAATGRVITIEEAQEAGGLGSAVAELIAQSGIGCKLRIIGVQDQFGTTAQTASELWEAKGLTAQNILAKLKEILD